MFNFCKKALLCVCLSFSITGVAMGGVVQWDRTPQEGVLLFDRVDFNWSLDNSKIDSLTVDFGDGSVVSLPGDSTGVRHIFGREGHFEVNLTVWVEGQAFPQGNLDQIQVGRRVVPGLNMMFLHHSTGRLLIKDSGVRSIINQHNNASGTDIRFWDHDYAYGNAYTGVILPDSTVHPDWIYGYEANNIQPVGYYDIFCQAPAFRDSLFNRHDVIVFKNDHSTGDIESDSQLESYKSDYLAIRDVLDQFPDKLFLMVSGPPRKPGNITNAEADRAREFYDWVQSPAYMNGHPNIAYFDLFDALSNPDDPQDPERNMLRPEYRRSTAWDDHPAELANLTIGPVFADFLLRSVDPDFYLDVSPAPELPAVGLNLKDAVPNPFNPATTLAWELAQPSRVSLKVFDVSGRLVRTLIAGRTEAAGVHHVLWRGQNDQGQPQPSGVYFYRLESPTGWATKRMTLVR